MTLTKIFIYTAIFALIVLIGAMASRKSKNLLVNFVQFFVGGFFIFSGIVKAIDPMGTAIKMEEYFEIFVEYTPFLEGFWHFWASKALGVSIFMIVLEIFLGITLILGQFVGMTLFLLVAIIAFFTFLTGFSHFENKVTDCGCFGDFLKIPPSLSFKKDIILSVLIAILLVGRKQIAKLIDGTSGLGIVTLATIIATWFTFSNYYNLPVKDFRAYKVGTHIPTCMILGPDAKQTIIETVYTYKKQNGEEVQFTPPPWPPEMKDWTFVSREDKVIQEGDEPKCKDMVINDVNGFEVTESILTAPKIFLLTSFDLERTSEKGLERLANVAKEAQAQGYEVVGITGSSLADADRFRHQFGMAFPFYNLDAVPIKTMNRSNPGLVLLEDGVIKGKWHHRKAKSLDKVLKSVK